MRRSLLFVLLPLACGPAVQSEDPDGSTSGGATPPGSDASSDASSDTDAPTTFADETSTSEGDREPLCGDGILHPSEGCDDGNERNADGCSADCRPSGSTPWSRPLASGFAVGLTSRDGAAVATVQQLQGIDPTVVLAGFDAEGVSRGVFVDTGGLSDLDIARNPVELLPDGRVALAYPVSDGTSLVRHFGVLDLGSGTVEGYLSEDPWTRTYGVATDAEAVLVLRGTVDGEARTEAFDANATHVWTEASTRQTASDAPLAEGALLRRSKPGGVAVTRGTDDVLVSWTLSPDQGQGTPLAMVPEGARPAAFSDGVRAWIWTGEALLETDEDTRVVQSAPRTFGGDLLWADAFGLVVTSGDELVLHDEQGNERLSVVLPLDPETGAALEPRFVRPDADGAGLFVLADAGIPPDGSSGPVSLHYVVR